MDIAKKSGGKETLIQIIKIFIVFDGFINSRRLDFRIYIRRVYKRFLCLMIYDLFVYPCFPLFIFMDNFIS